MTSAKFHARDALDEKEADLVQMTHVDTPNILHTLRKRHADGLPPSAFVRGLQLEPLQEGSG